MNVPYSWQYELFNGQDSVFWGIWAGFMVIMLIIWAVMMLVSIGIYVFQSLGLYTIAKRRGHDNPWMAWVPVANMYQMGDLADKLVVQNGRRDWYMRWWLLGGMIGYMVIIPLSAIPVIGILFALLAMPVAIGLAVIEYFAFYELLKEYEPAQKVLYLVLSIVISPLFSVFLFVIRNKPGLHPDASVKEEIE